MTKSTIHISSSRGIIAVTDDGYPIVSTLPVEYNNIVRFDIQRLERMCNVNHIAVNREWNILAVGYWLDDGTYENPAPDYSETGCMRYIWMGRVQDYDEACDINDN